MEIEDGQQERGKPSRSHTISPMDVSRRGEKDLTQKLEATTPVR
jgi:hypothetical protein